MKESVNLMELIGQSVSHRAFGAGVVAGIADGIVTVRFPDGERKFVYPDAFTGFMVLEDRESQRRVEKQISSRNAAAKKALRAHRAEQDQKRRLMNYTVTANSHAVFNIPPEQLNSAAAAAQVSTGTYLSGSSKGKPRLAERMKPNSVCLLTVCPPGTDESQRRIAGAFMAAVDFFGEDAVDGIVMGHPQHRILLSADVRPLFWKYFGQKAPPRWGPSAFKYCSGDVVNSVLADMAEILRSSGQGSAAMDFYRYFCKTNSLRPLIEPDEPAAEGKE